MEAENIGDIGPEAQTFVTVRAETGLLDPESDEPERLRHHLERIERRFLRRMADRSRYSWRKRFWLSAAEAGVDVGDDKGVDAYIENLNARPETERRDVIGRVGSAGQRRGRFTPPRTKPQPPGSSTQIPRGRSR